MTNDEEFSAEIESHLQLEADRIAGERGLSPDDAMAAARREFGNVTAHRERHFESRRWMPIERLRRDARLACRRLIRERRFTLTATVTIALCLGGNLAIFAAVDAILLRPLPFRDAGRLVTIYNTYPKAGVMDDGASVANYYERRGAAALPSLTDIGLFRHTTAIVGDTGATEREDVTVVTPEFFDALGVTAALGRLITAEDMAGTGTPVAVITDAAWHRYFNADPNVLGRTLRIDGSPFAIAGVLPASFRFLSSRATVYGAYLSRPEQRLTAVRHSGSGSQMIARLAPGATLASAQREIDAQNAVLEREEPEAEMMASVGFRSVVVSLHDRHVESARPLLWLLQLGALSLLGIGIVNLTNLLIVRASGRGKEAAVRRAIGASRWDLTRGILVETVITALAGGITGIAVAAAGVRLLASLGADQLPLGATVGLDARVIASALFVTLVIGLLMAVPVAWLTIRGGLPSGLGAHTRGGTASRGLQRLRQSFVVAQIGLAFVLLCVAGLLSVSLGRVMAAPKGFSPEHTLTGHVSLPVRMDRLRGGFLRADRLAFVTRLVDELKRQPGVVAAAVASNVPLSGDDMKSAATVPGDELEPGAVVPHASYSYWVSREYFTAMGMTLVNGRLFDAADDAEHRRVALIDTDFARRKFPNGDALGHHVFLGSRVGPDAEAFTIVGVVDAAKQSALTDDSRQGAVYYPTAFYTNNRYFIVVRTNGSVEALAPAIPRIVRDIDPDLPVSDLRTMATMVSESTMAQRSPAFVTIAFAVLALLLAAVGTHGVISYAIAERQREIGLRLALGAQPSQIRMQFLAVGARLLAFGLAVGLLGALVSGRLLQASLYNTAAVNLPILAGASGVMVVLLAVACLLPSGRAARLSPMIAMAED
jgi:predicted permease